MNTDSWLRTLRPSGRSRRTDRIRGRLVCWPHAGGSPAVFAPFAAALPEFEVCAVQPPGRASRFGEPPVTDPVEAVAAVRAAIEAAEPLDELVLLGHSMGAAMANRLAVELGTAVHTLVLSAWPAPGREYTETPSSQDNRALLEFMRRLESPGLEELDEQEVTEFLLPPLAADLALGEAAGPTAHAAKAPILLTYGERDPVIWSADVRAWRETARVRAEFPLPGGHFAIFEHIETLAGAIRKRAGS
ncbi:thioesterase II family protein [Sciscionella marina]|uniref:thioesterase II family protein n=1 Tax=Sciscionella marina TaxID=508770 RepID=UPI000399E023|nr:alpha/beta fold hydrolase [Sciscionella marina]